MSSKLADAKSRNEIYVCLNAKYEHHWRDFTLQYGHVFGWSPEISAIDDDSAPYAFDGHFVVYREMQNSIILYCSHREGPKHIWEKYAIEKDSRTGEAILNVLSTRKGGVRFRPLDEQNVKKTFKQKLVTEAFTPMPNMRIPMGSFKTVHMEEHSFGGMLNPPDYCDIIRANVANREKIARRKAAAQTRLN